MDDFKEWFAGSKIVHEDGSPRMVYRGMSDKGLRPTPGFGMIIIALDRNIAASFAGEGRRLRELYVRAVKPFDYRNPQDVAWLVPEMIKPENLALFNKQTKEIMGDNYEHELDAGVLELAIETGEYQAYEVPIVVEKIRARGYDGIYLREDLQPSQLEPNLGVFDASQIRFAEDVGDIAGFTPAAPARRAPKPR